MKTINRMDVGLQAASGGAAGSERFMFGPCALIAPLQPQAKGSSVPAGGLNRTPVTHDPAAIKDGAVSGLRSWRHPV